MAGVWLLYFGFGLTTASMAPLVAPIKSALDISDGAMGSVLGAWPLVYIIMAIPCGALLDRFGTRRSLLVAGGIIAAFLGVKAEGKSLESIAQPLTAEDDASSSGGEREHQNA